MSKKGKTQFVLLGLIIDGPKSGYEMKKTIECSIGYFWQESYGQIYPALHFLSKQNYISKKSVNQKSKPDKIIYSITKSGIEYFQNWLKSPINNPPQRNELLLRLFFGSASNINNSITILENHIIEYSKLYNTFLDIKKLVHSNHVIDSGPVENSTFSMLTLEYGIMSCKTEIDWAKKATLKLKNINKKTKKE